MSLGYVSIQWDKVGAIGYPEIYSLPKWVMHP
jgi:hypothetical protein